MSGHIGGPIKEYTEYTRALAQGSVIFHNVCGSATPFQITSTIPERALIPKSREHPELTVSAVKGLGSRA